MAVTAHPASQRAIDPHDLPLSLRLMRGGFRALRWVSRRLTARVVAHLFVKPRRHAVPERERVVLAQGTRSSVTCEGRRIAVWTFEPVSNLVPNLGPDPAAPRGTALLVHGWEGRGGQLGAWVEPLRAEGFRVVTFDHVGHGESEGLRCSLPTMRDTLRCVAEAVLPEGGGGPSAGPSAVVAHSMGTFAASLLLADGWRQSRVLYLSPPDDLLVYFARYLELVTGSDELLPDLIQLMEERFGEKADEFEFHKLVETLDQPLHVIHSRDDLDVPIEGGRYVAEHWPGATIQEVDGLGHRKILRDPAVIADGMAFFARPSA
ncbi:MAG: pimeloyl-ACP methyl ester carboxylesterase [Planctomycetota bacterium]|jgi:pimeloyl-ACP methyl ester carboxylesterase